MKKMYNQPKTDVLPVETEYMMLDSVSPGASTDPTKPPTPHAPKHGDIIE